MKSSPHHISRLGGVGIFVAFFMGLFFFINDLGESPDFSFYLAVIFLFLLGLNDDIFDLKAWVKFVIQIFVVIFVVTYGEIKYLTFIFDSMAINAFAGTIFSVVLLVYVVNAFNLIDGIDGLAAMLGAVINLILGLALILNGDLLYGGLAFVLFGTLCGFLVFNFSPAKVFMGDSGSMIIGFISSVVALRFIELNKEVFYSIYTSSVVVLALFIVPVYDTFRVFFIRLRLNKSPFRGDENHIHHRLRKLGFCDWQIVFLLTFYTLVMVFFVILLYDIGDVFLSLILLITCILFNIRIDYLLKKTLIQKT
ncbi:MraY family glycosyltransferase [Pedobacter sp. CG_S7]|uniref:MraY family glycosyltransferase n=1 Tax=Pedobacter sp. CG_S7 TaxID=3143930 RepID=UPI0033920290